MSMPIMVILRMQCTSHKICLALKFIEIDEVSVNLLHKDNESDYQILQKFQGSSILKNKNDTQLSNKLWKVKDSEETPVITGNILGQ